MTPRLRMLLCAATLVLMAKGPSGKRIGETLLAEGMKRLLMPKTLKPVARLNDRRTA